MSKGYENFNNMETSFRKSTLIQERIGLVSTHMYKQFLDYQHATMNTTEIFAEMIDNLKIEELADEILTKDELLSTLEKYYTKEQQEKYGTLGIRIKLIAN